MKSRRKIFVIGEGLVLKSFGKNTCTKKIGWVKSFELPPIGAGWGFPMERRRFRSISVGRYRLILERIEPRKR